MAGIGFYIDDIDARFWKQSTIYMLIGGALFAFVSVLVFRMRSVIRRQLGGEPQDAAASMKTIANGDLGFEIVLEKGDNTSLMASLKVMQMKLINLTSAVQENAQNLSDSVSISIRHVVASPCRASALSAALRLMSYRSENGMSRSVDLMV